MVEAGDSYRRSLALMPTYLDALINLAGTLATWAVGLKRSQAIGWQSSFIQIPVSHARPWPVPQSSVRR